MSQDVPHTTEASNPFERAVRAPRAHQRGGHRRQAGRACSSLTRSSSVPFCCGSFLMVLLSRLPKRTKWDANTRPRCNPSVSVSWFSQSFSRPRLWGISEVTVSSRWLRFEKTSLSSTGERKRGLRGKQLPSTISQCIPGFMCLMYFFQIYIKVNTTTKITSVFMDLQKTIFCITCDMQHTWEVLARSVALNRASQTQMRISISGPGSILGQGTRSYVLQVNIPYTPTKMEDPTCCS